MYWYYKIARSLYSSIKDLRNYFPIFDPSILSSNLYEFDDLSLPVPAEVCNFWENCDIISKKYILASEIVDWFHIIYVVCACTG